LDVFDFCTPALQAQLAAPRDALKGWQDKLAADKRTAKQIKTDAGPKPGPGAAEAAAAGAGAGSSGGAAAAVPGAGDVEMQDAAAASSSSGAAAAGALTGALLAWVWVCLVVLG
jgi:hypothetical protein